MSPHLPWVSQRHDRDLFWRQKRAGLSAAVAEFAAHVPLIHACRRGATQQSLGNPSSQRFARTAVGLGPSSLISQPPAAPVRFVGLQIAQGQAKGRALGHLPLQGGCGPSALSLTSCLSRCLLTCFLLFLHNSTWLMGVLLLMTPR